MPFPKEIKNKKKSDKDEENGDAKMVEKGQPMKPKYKILQQCKDCNKKFEVWSDKGPSGRLEKDAICLGCYNDRNGGGLF
jgi:hypothetical protein